METLKVDQQEYKAALEAARSWLDSTRGKVESCDDTSGDPNALQGRIDVVKVNRSGIIFRQNSFFFF